MNSYAPAHIGGASQDTYHRTKHFFISTKSLIPMKVYLNAKINESFDTSASFLRSYLQSLWKTKDCMNQNYILS